LVKRCRDCEEFRKIFGCAQGGGLKCSKDDTPDRGVIYALDYACNNIKEVPDQQE
jgi:hypothetical protein